MAIATIRLHAAIGIRFHQAACVYPCEFSTSFMPETIIPTINVGCAAAGPLTRGPQFSLQLGGSGIYLRKPLLIAGRIGQDTLIKIFDKQRTYFRRIGGKQEVGRTYSVPIALASASS